MTKYQLAVDAGNTDIVIGLYKNKTLLTSLRLSTDSFSSASLNSHLTEIAGDKTVTTIGIACVVPRITKELLETCSKLAPILNITADLFPQLTIRADNRNELGADFIASYYGAITKYQAPITLFDLGSATKTMVITTIGEISGVAIRPGLLQSLQAMNSNIPHLPPIELDKPQDIIGHNTEEAIKAGVFYGELSAIQAYSQLIDQHYNFNSTKILTGGHSFHFSDYLNDFHYEPDIVLQGIIEICSMKTGQ